MEWLQTVCNLIIIIGGALMAIKSVAEWFGKPIRLFKKRSDKNFDKRVEENLNKVLPPILLNHDLETRDKYRADRERYLQEIKDEVLKSIQDELKQIGTLTEQYHALVLGTKDVLREKIMMIYHKNKKDKVLTVNEKEALEQYYKDYKAMGGNSYIDKYYKRMQTWAVSDDDYDDDITIQ